MELSQEAKDVLAEVENYLMTKLDKLSLSSEDEQSHVSDTLSAMLTAAECAQHSA